MPYASQSDIEAVFGPDNVAAWSRFDPGPATGTADPARVASALAYADSEINSFFAGGPYALPLVCQQAGKVISYWAGVLAGVWLYGSRTSVSYIDYIGNRNTALREMVFADMQLYKAGVKRLDAAAKYPHASSPSA